MREKCEGVAGTLKTGDPFKIGSYMTKRQILAQLHVHAAGVGYARIARRTGLNRESMYKALHRDGNPTLDTLVRIADEVGVDIIVEARRKRSG